MDNKVIKADNLLALSVYDLSDLLPDMDDMVAMPIDLTINYWSPEAAGDSKKLFLKGVSEEERTDEETGDKYMADVAYFIEQMSDGTHRQIINQSVRLVSAVKQLQSGTALQITYTGKKRTQNGHNIDTWAIQPLVRRNTVQADDDDPFS